MLLGIMTTLIRKVVIKSHANEKGAKVFYFLDGIKKAALINRKCIETKTLKPNCICPILLILIQHI